MDENIKLAFVDQYHKIGIGLLHEDGKREVLTVDIPEDIALKIFRFTHPDCKEFKDD